MPNYPDRYNDLLPVDPSSQLAKSSASTSEAPFEPSHETSDIPQEGSISEKNEQTSDILEQSPIDTPQEGSTSELEPTTSNMTYGGSFAKMVPPPCETPKERCVPEKVKFQIVQPEGVHISDCSSDSAPLRKKPETSSGSIVQRRCSNPCVKKYTKCGQRLSEVEENNFRCSPSKDVVFDCNTKNSQLPPIISFKTEAAYPTDQQPPSKCDTCMYRRSIESWEPLKGAIYCPKCQHFETPLLRTKTKKTKSYFNSNCLVHCWPLCFIPYLFATPPQHFLHCAECFKFLGTYDETHKCVRPNREYLDCGGCFSAEESKRQERLQNEAKWKEYLNC